MKKIHKIIAIIIIIALIIANIYFFEKHVASADALTASMIGATAYSLMTDWGVSFTSSSASASGMNSWMTNQVEDYVNSRGGSIVSLFGSEILRVTAGKLVVGQQIYNGVKDFVNWLGDKFGNSGTVNLSTGQISGDFVPDFDRSNEYDGQTIPSGIGVGYTDYVDQSLDSSYVTSGYTSAFYYQGGYSKGTFPTTGLPSAYNGQFDLYYSNGYVYFRAYIHNLKTGIVTGYNSKSLRYSGTLPNKLSSDWTNFTYPSVLNPDKEWVGDYGASPDTNLDQLIGQIYQDVADNNLDVDGEIVDIPVPGPTPVPAPTPVIDVLDGINTQIGQLDGIGNDIGNIADNLDDLGALQEEAVDALEGIQEGIGTQTGILGGINTKVGSIDQTLTGTQDAVNDISDTLTDALDVPSAQESSDYKFDLSTLFPFCIPFDIARMLRAFDGAAAAPHFQIPIVISSIGFSYTLDLDFQMFDPVAAVLRQVELIAFAIALAYATSKVIRW